MKKIFVADCASLGDTLLATPTLRAIKETYPQSRTIVMASPSARQILEGHPFVDDLVLYKKGDSIFPIIRKIWRADLALILDYHYRSSLFTWLARIPVRIGRGSKKNSFLTHQIFESPDLNTYEVENTLVVARRFGINTQDFCLVMPECRTTEKEHVHTLLAEHGIDMPNANFIVLAPYSLSSIKDWPEEYYREVISFLKSKQLEVIVVGGIEHREAAQRLTGSINLVGLTGIRETTHLISLAKLVVCGCTSVLHFAATTNTPQLAIYGPTLPQQWAPRSNCTVINKQFSCSPCYNTGRVCHEDKRCLREIKPQEVCSMATKILSLE